MKNNAKIFIRISAAVLSLSCIIFICSCSKREPSFANILNKAVALKTEEYINKYKKTVAYDLTGLQGTLNEFYIDDYTLYLMLSSDTLNYFENLNLNLIHGGEPESLLPAARSKIKKDNTEYTALIFTGNFADAERIELSLPDLKDRADVTDILLDNLSPMIIDNDTENTVRLDGCTLNISGYHESEISCFLEFSVMQYGSVTSSLEAAAATVILHDEPDRRQEGISPDKIRLRIVDENGNQIFKKSDSAVSAGGVFCGLIFSEKSEPVSEKRYLEVISTESGKTLEKTALN